MPMTNRISSLKKLAEFLKHRDIAAIQELKDVVGTDVSMTIYRMLKRLSYRTSYSHNGRYYALNKTLKFNQQGLWTTRSVWFSRHGTLLATLERFVSDSEGGFFAQELENLLHVGVKESLLRLVQRGRICRERVSHSYLYCSKNSSVRRQQIADRHAELAGTGVNVLFKPGEISDEVKAAIILFTALLDERQRRLFAGIEALQFGRGAERWIAHLLGIHHQTVSKGRRQLLEGDVEFKRIRRKGGGRPRIEKKLPKSSMRSEH